MNAQFTFLDVNDYNDFNFFLDLIDSEKLFSDTEIEKAYAQYIIFRDVYATNEKVHDKEFGFRGYLVDTQNTEMECPHCKTKFDINDKDSTHQVNHNNEETYCSYACSTFYTINVLEKRLNKLHKESKTRKDQLIFEELLTIIENT